jgi:lipoprotein-anchoring transpeptidase ErfK/SrfK
VNTSDPQVDSLFRFAQAAARSGRKTEARRLLWAALQLDPDQAELWIWLAAVASSPRASLGYLARALTLDPHNQRARAGVRWARRQAAASAAAPALPTTPPISFATRTRPVPQSRGWWWAASATVLVLMVVSAAGLMLFPGLTALAAGEIIPTQISKLLDPPAAVQTDLPTRTQELPPTWTPTPTKTATPTITPTPTASITPTPTNTVPPSPTWVPTLLPTPIPPGSSGERWIDVNLSQQLLIAYEGSTPVRWISISTGLPRTPTVVGQFRIYVKLLRDDMSGDDYYLPGVPYVMYFYKGYGLHGTYWHSNFGRPMSHGCVNLPTPEAEWLFSFASVGTLVNVHY